MSHSFLPLAFPRADQATLLWIGLALVVLFLGALAMEYFRRRANRRAQIKAEWDMVERMMREKEFSKEEQNLLRGLIRRRSSDNPLQAVTARRSFDACVEAEMAALQAETDEDRFKEAGILLREIRVRLDLDYVPFGQSIHSTRELNIGQAIWVAEASSGSPEWVKGSVLAVDEAYLHVTVRDAQAARAPELVRGSEVRCYLWREDDARYEFRTAVAYSEGTPQTWSLLHSANLHRVQARNYYRVRYNQETTIGVLGASGAAAEEADTAVPRRVITRLRGRICSLSAGGLALVTQQGVHTQARLRVALEIPEEEPFDADVETVGVEPISGGRYLVRGMFVRIGEDKRDVIARYVLRRQRPLAASPEKSAGERGLVEQE